MQERKSEEEERMEQETENKRRTVGGFERNKINPED